MKVIIAGGRNYKPTEADIHLIECIFAREEIEEIVSGGAAGADAFGEEMADVWAIPVKVFQADWVRHGRAAGPIRNAQMADYADAVILLPGGRGTANMKKLAVQRGLNVLLDLSAESR